MAAALAVAAAGIAWQHQRAADPHVAYDRWHLPAFDAYVYVAMAEQPRFFTVAPWGHRILTPWLVSALPLRNVARAFRIVVYAALMAAGALLFLYVRALGFAPHWAVLAAAALVASPPVAEAVRYVFLAEPLTLALEIAFLFALQAGAGGGTLLLLAVAGTLSKEFFILLTPLALVMGPRRLSARAALAATLMAASAAAAIALRVVWTPHIGPPLPSAEPVTLLLAIHRFHDSFPEWWTAALLGGIAPLAVVGLFREGGRPLRLPALVTGAVAVVPPFLNPVTFFSSDVPRLLVYALPVAIPLAVAALARPGEQPRLRMPRRLDGALAVLAAALAVAPLLLVDRYRRADLTGPRDGPYVMAVAHETVRTGRRLERGEEVVLDPAERRFAWGDAHPSQMDRMRWFLREGWGQRAHYGTGEVTLHEARGTILLPVFAVRDLEADVHAQSPRADAVRATINGHPAGTWTVGPESGPERLRFPASALFRGDNLLTLECVSGAPGLHLRSVVLRQR